MLTDELKFQGEEKKEGMTWIHQRGIQTLTHSESPQLYNHEVEARVNEKRLTFVDPHQQSYALSKTPSVCIA